MFRPTFESLENRTLMAADLAIHAEKNQDIAVENDETHVVGHDFDPRVTIGAQRTETVGKDETITVAGWFQALTRNEQIKAIELLAKTGEVAIETLSASIITGAGPGGGPHRGLMGLLLPYMEQGNVFRLAGQQANANGIIAILIGLMKDKPANSPSILASDEYYNILGRSAGVTHDVEFESWANALRSGNQKLASLAGPIHCKWYVPELDSDSSAM